MAQYQKPPDPRQPDDKQSQRLRQDSGEPVPWKWLGLGIVVTILGLATAVWLANALLSRPPLSEAAVAPTIIVLTAPPAAAPTETPILDTPTPIPTFTPVPTPNTDVAPLEITIGFYAEVANTGGVGVAVRGGPSISNVQQLVAPEGTLLFVLDGPESGNDLLWWQVRLDDGTEGWVAGDFIIPAAGP